MEGTVPSLRILTASAIFLMLAAASAFAQTATAAAPGKPLQLFQIIEQKDDTGVVKPQHRVRYVRRRVARTHVTNQTTGAMHHAYMEVRPTPQPEQAAATPPATTLAAATPSAATAAAPTNIWPAPDALPGAQALAPPPASNEPVAAANQSEMLTAAYHTVQVTPPIAAQETPPDTAQITPPNPVDPADTAADHQHVAANAAGPNDAAPKWPVQHAMVATAEPQNPNPVGSASWIAHVLAALVGAIATGALAWVLINPLPARSYE